MIRTLIGFIRSIATATALTIILPTANPLAAAQEQLITRHDGLAAYVQPRKNGSWCASQVKVLVRAQDISAFAIEEGHLEKLAGLLRKDMQAGCAKIRSIRILGFVGDRRVYTGLIRDITKSSALVHRQIVKELQAATTFAGSSGRGGGEKRHLRDDAGTLSAARTLGAQCAVLNEWVSRLYDEYPGIQQARDPQEIRRKAINLLGDAYFVPVFGRRFDETDQAFRQHVLNQVFKKCPRKDRLKEINSRRLFKQFFGNPGGATSFEELALRVQEGRSNRTWLQNQHASIANTPISQSGYDQLEAVATMEAKRIADLWPSEQQPFRTAVSERRRDVAANLASRQISSLSIEENSLARLHGILGLAADRLGDRNQESFAALMALAAEKRSEIRVGLLQSEIAAVEGSPNTLDSLSRIHERQKHLQRLVGGMPHLAELDRYDETAKRRGREIAPAGLLDFQAELAALPISLPGAATALARFEGLAPVLRALAPENLENYHNAAVNRTDAIYQAMIDHARREFATFEGGWGQTSELIADAREQAARFDGTRAEDQAQSLISAAIKRANEIVAHDLAAFRQRLDSTETSWRGLGQLNQLADSIRQLGREVEAFSVYGAEAVSRRESIISAVFESALADITETGDHFRHIDDMRNLARQHAGRFEAAGDQNKAQQLLEAADYRTMLLLERHYPDYRAEIAAMAPSKANAAALRQQAQQFLHQAQTAPAFADYGKAADDRAGEIDTHLCAETIRRAGLSGDTEREAILGPVQPMTLRAFVCALDARGHSVPGTASPGIPSLASGYSITVRQADGQKVRFKLKNIEEKDGKPVLVVHAIQAENLQDQAIRREEWQLYAALLLGLEPSPAILNMIDENAPLAALPIVQRALFSGPSEQEIIQAYLQEMSSSGPEIGGANALILRPLVFQLMGRDFYVMNIVDRVELGECQRHPDRGYVCAYRMYQRIEPSEAVSAFIRKDEAFSKLIFGLTDLFNTVEPELERHHFLKTPDGWRSPSIREAILERERQAMEANQGSGDMCVEAGLASFSCFELMD